MDERLKKNIEGWLQTEGYPLEMRTAAAFLKEGFDTRQGDHYLDPEKPVSREIDVVADLTETEPHWSTVTFVCECKGSPRFPWVLFTSEHLQMHPKARTLMICASKVARRAVGKICDLDDFDEFPVLQAESVLGYALRQALSDKRDDAYAALMTVTKAAVARVEEADEVVEGLPTRSGCALPLIVIAAPLFSCGLNPDRTFDLQEIKRGTIVWRDRTIGRSTTFIDVVTEDELPRYAADAKKTGVAMINYLRDWRAEAV